MSPDMLRARIAALEELPTSFHIEVMAGDLEIYGSLDEDPRSLDVAELIQDFAHLLPDLVIHASGHDVGSQVFGEDFRSVAAQLLSKGQCEFKPFLDIPYRTRSLIIQRPNTRKRYSLREQGPKPSQDPHRRLL